MGNSDYVSVKAIVSDWRLLLRLVKIKFKTKFLRLSLSWLQDE